MTRPVLLRAEHVSKRFSRNSRPTMWNTFQDIAQQMTGSSPRSRLREGEFWALQDISFEIRQGESVAIIGDNGAGKSTLIKLLMRRMLPTSGHLEANGSISALTVLGLGFDPVLSGRENILLNAATLGLSRRETLKVMDDIIDFAELREFIDTPIQTYSSGMKSRLGYAVAAHVNPDILLLDEVLAVGDIRFRRKCRRHIKNFIAGGGTTLLVTHDLHAAQTICDRCMVLEKGRLLFDGAPTDGINFYLETQLATADDEPAHVVLNQAMPSDFPVPMADGTTSEMPRGEIPATDATTSSDSGPTDVTCNESAWSPAEAELAPPGNELYEGSDELPTGPESAVEHPDTETEATQEVESIPLEPEEAEVLSESVSLGEPESTDVSSRQNTVVVIESLSMHAVDGKHLRTDHGAELVMRYRSMVRIDHVAWGITITTEDGQIQICTFIYGYSGKSYSVLPGVHAFKIRLDRLPLHAGRYGLKGGIGEVDSGAAIAEKGWEDALVYFTVRSDPSPENSVHANMNNLVVINGIPVAE